MKSIEATILMVIGFFLAAGIILILNGYGLGVIIAGLAVLAIAGGWRTFKPSKPFQVGAVTIYGDYLKTGSRPQGPDDVDTRKTVAVRGYTILAPYFPLFIDAEVVDMTAEDWTFELTIMSVEDPDRGGKRRSVPVKGKIIMTVVPDEDHLNSFAQSGSDLKKIKELLGGIPYRTVQQLVKTMPGGANNDPGLSFIEMVQQGDLISAALETKLNGDDHYVGVFEEKAFGIRCKKVQVEFEVPAEIAAAMIDAGKIEFETSARAQEYDGDVQAAARFAAELHVSSERGWEMAVVSRMLREGTITRKQFEGLGLPVGTMLLENTNDDGGNRRRDRNNPPNNPQPNQRRNQP